MTPNEFKNRLDAMDLRDRKIRRDWGKAIEEQRKLMGYSRKQLAAILEVGQNTVSYWETGRSAPRPSMQVEIAKALNISHSTLFRISA